VIIFGKFGGGRSKQDRAVQVRAMTGYGPDRGDPLRSRRLTRATDLPCTPPMCSEGSGVTFPPATNGGAARSATLHSRGFNRASFRLPHLAPISNRELDLLERDLNHCEQRTATVSNRELSTNRCSCNFPGPISVNSSRYYSPLAASHSFTLTKEGPLACPDAGRATSHCSTFLPGSVQYVECGVTHSKQKTVTGDYALDTDS
jgi:hypothetical protein